jgi:hypothetical protein
MAFALAIFGALRVSADITAGGGGSSSGGGGGGPTLSGDQTWTGTNTYNVIGGVTLAAGAGGIVASNQAPIMFASGTGGGRIVYQTNDTPDTLLLAPGAASNALVFAEEADQAFDFGHALRLYPMVYLHSQSQSQTKYLGLGHNDTDGLIEIGSGGFRVSTAACSGLSTLCIGGNVATASTQTFNYATAIGDLARAWNQSTVAIGTNALVTNSSGLAIGTSANVTGDGGIAIGAQAAALAGQLAIGRPDALWVTEAYLGGSGPGGGGSATPVAYAVKGGAGLGTNIKGAPQYMDGGLGTGNAASAPAYLRSGGLLTASSTTKQTIVPRVVGGVAKILTNNTVTTVASAVLASDSSVVLRFDCAAESIDAAHAIQHDAGTIVCSITNSNGTFANNACSTPTGVRNVATSGTITSTWTITAANPALVQVNVNSSLTPSTGYPRITCNVANLTQQDVTFP